MIMVNMIVVVVSINTLLLLMVVVVNIDKGSSDGRLVVLMIFIDKTIKSQFSSTLTVCH